jgi:hypothetical protein
MTSYTSREQDAAQRVKEARAQVEACDRSYRNGGSLTALNNANRRLADAQYYLSAECGSGVVHDPSAGN